MKAFRVNIVGLSKSEHLFTFEVSDFFFKEYGSEMISKGELTATVLLNKTETFIEAKFSIRGLVELTCDRSLDPFEYPLQLEKKIVFKYGEEEMEISDEILVISRDRIDLDLGQFIYEFIALGIPAKKLHPRFTNEQDENESDIIYTSSHDDETEATDPRWDQLKKLK